MATVNNVVIPNVPANSTTTAWSVVWALSRGLKKAGWKYMGSAGNGSKNATTNPAADLWNGTDVVTNAGASAASIANPTRGRATITGLTGIVSEDKGRFLVLTGAATGANNQWHQIEEVIDSTSVRVDARNFAVASDANNGSITWSIRDPYGTEPAGLATTYGWWCARGPSMLRIPITSAPSTSFIRGENITQSTTGAQGELVGYVYDSGSGYLVVAPRLRGTGSGAYGWDTSLVITGDVSGATVTQVGSTVEFRHELVLWKLNTASAGHIFHGVFDVTADAAEMFSTLVSSSGCTSTVAPGGTGSGNAFPLHAWVSHGGSNLIGAPHIWCITTSVTITKGHAICVDAIEETGYSADGSWWALFETFFNTVPGYGANYNVHGFSRLDDCEPGDVFPYVSVNPGGTQTLYSNVRTGVASGLSAEAYDTLGGGFNFSTSRVVFKSWWRRGLPGEWFIDLEAAHLYGRQTGTFVSYYGSTSNDNLQGNLSATDPRSDSPPVRLPIYIVCLEAAHKTVKGTLRWAYTVTVPGGTGDIFDGYWLRSGSGANNAGSGSVVVGPWNGTLVY